MTNLLWLEDSRERMLHFVEDYLLEKNGYWEKYDPFEYHPFDAYVDYMLEEAGEVWEEEARKGAEEFERELSNSIYYK